MSFFSNGPRVRLSPRLLGLGSFFAALACATYLLFGFGYSCETTEVSATSDGTVGTETVTREWDNALSVARQNHDYAIVGWAGFIVVLGVLTVFVAPVALLATLTAGSLSAARRRGPHALPP